MAPPAPIPPVPQAVAAAYDPYRSLSALGSKYMDASAGYGAAAAAVHPVGQPGGEFFFTFAIMLTSV